MSNGTPQIPVTPVNAPSTGSTQFCTVEYVPGHLRMHTISEDKLDMITSGNAPLHLAFFGLCVGAAISFGTVIRTVNLAVSDNHLFSMFFYASLVMGSYFGIRGLKDYFGTRAKVDEIKGIKKSN
jgi:hypothetical protein